VRNDDKWEGQPTAGKTHLRAALRSTCCASAAAEARSTRHFQKMHDLARRRRSAASAGWAAVGFTRLSEPVCSRPVARSQAVPHSVHQVMRSVSSCAGYALFRYSATTMVGSPQTTPPDAYTQTLGYRPSTHWPCPRYNVKTFRCWLLARSLTNTPTLLAPGPPLPSPRYAAIARPSGDQVKCEAR